MGIFTAKNFKISGDRTGLTRSAIFMGPEDFNGYGYFYVRLYWTGFGLPANIVEEYILLSALLHVIAGIKRTVSGKLIGGVWASLRAGNLNLAISGLTLLTFMTIHLFQFRFGATEPYNIVPPPYLINFSGILSLNLFWSKEGTPVPVRDIYKLEYDLFTQGDLAPFWTVFYICCVFVFMTHASLGWKQIVRVKPCLGIPKDHIRHVEIYGFLIFFVIGLIYISFPLFCNFEPPFARHEANLQRPGKLE